MKEIRFGLSPCPNDTFMFDAIFNNRIDTGDYNFIPVMEDVEYLNKAAISGDIQVTKMSYFTFLQLTSQFQMLQSGGALGLNCGPLLISNDPSKKVTNDSIVAIPGSNTTANLLLTMAFPDLTNKQEVLFSEIESGIADGSYDFGLIIHESRFTYESRGLHKILDLGQYWEDNTNSAIPLGGIAVQRSLDAEIKDDISDIVKKSVLHAFSNPNDSKHYVAQHAQEMEQKICKLHIETYVNEYSKHLGDFGKAGVENLINTALHLDLVDLVTRPLFV